MTPLYPIIFTTYPIHLSTSKIYGEPSNRNRNHQGDEHDREICEKAEIILKSIDGS